MTATLTGDMWNLSERKSDGPVPWCRHVCEPSYSLSEEKAAGFCGCTAVLAPTCGRRLFDGDQSLGTCIAEVRPRHELDPAAALIATCTHLRIVDSSPFVDPQQAGPSHPCEGCE